MLVMFLCCSIPLVASIASPATRASGRENTIHFVVIIASRHWIVRRGRKTKREWWRKDGTRQRSRTRQCDMPLIACYAPGGTQERQFPMNSLRLLQHVQWLHHAEHDILLPIFPAGSRHDSIYSH